MCIFQKKTLLFILLLIFAVFKSNAYPLEISDDKRSFDVGVAVEYLLDSRSGYSINEVVRMDSLGLFVAPSKTPLNFGYSDKAYWVSFSMFGKTHSLSGWILDVPYAPLDSVTLYVPDGNGGYSAYKSGDRLKSYEKLIEHRNPVFSLGDEIIPYDQYYIRVESGGAVNLPLKLWTGAGYIKYLNNSQTGIGIYFGIMLALLLYNVFLYFYVRDKDFLLCILVLASHSVTQGIYNGMASLFLWPDMIWWANNSLPIAAVTMFMCIAIFTNSFLRLNKLAPRLNWVMRSFIAIFVCQILFYPVVGYRMTSVLSIFFSIALIFSVFLTAIIVYSRGYKPARFLLLAWSVFLFGLVLLLLKLIGVLPHTFLTEYVVQIGFTITATFLSFALTDRVNILRKEKDIAKQQVLDRLKESENMKTTFLTEAEKLVEKRTRELEGVNQKLVEMAATDMLTGLYNRRVFNETIEKEFNRAKRSGDEISIIIIDIDYFKNYNDYYGHIEGDRCIRKLAEVFKDSVSRSSDVLSRYGGEEFAIILSDIRLDEAVKIAEDIRYMVEEAQIPHNMAPSGYVTVSCGVSSIVPAVGDKTEDLINKADQALFRAKSQGRNRVVVSGY